VACDLPRRSPVRAADCSPEGLAIVEPRVGTLFVFLACLLVVNGEGRLLRRHGEATLEALRHARHQYPVAEALPALLRLVNRDDRPAIFRRPRRDVVLPAEAE
jgi:hypothetical protein